MEQRLGNWCGTYSGIKFWTIDSRPEEVNIIDIAHSLSQICRFNGHCKYFYSVAQHSIAVAKMIKQSNESKRARLLGLIHDSTEAYLCDIPTPLKGILPNYKELEHTVQNTIYDAYSISYPTKEEKSMIKCYDREMLFLEAKELMNGYDSWNLPEPKFKYKIKYEDMKKIEVEFIQMFNELISVINNN